MGADVPAYRRLRFAFEMIFHSVLRGGFLFAEVGKIAKLTPKQERFCEEYLVDLNATQAAIRAGYKNSDIGRRLVTKSHVQKHIAELREKLTSEKIADVIEVMEYLTSVMRGNSESEIIVVEGRGEGCSSARHVVKRPDEKERLKAAELIGKRFGMFDKKDDGSVSEEVRIVDDV